MSVIHVQMMVPVRQKKKGKTVCKEKRAIKMWKKRIIGILMHGRKWFEIDHLSVDPAVNAFTGITELIWGITLEGAEKSKEKYMYFYLMFPMDSIPSILDYTNITLLAKKKAALSKESL